jgi:hypothetical protein
VLETEKMVTCISADAGSSWGDAVVLDGQRVDAIELDLTDLRFPDPLLLIRLRAFIDWHCARGREVHVTLPRLATARTYLERMHLGSNLPAGCLCDLETLGADEHSPVLIPIRRLRSPIDGDELEHELEDLYLWDISMVLSPS